MTPGQRARKRELIERMGAANITHIRLTLDEATYLLDCADLPDAEKRLEAMHSAALVDRNHYKTLYEKEKARVDELQSQEPIRPRHKNTPTEPEPLGGYSH